MKHEIIPFKFDDKNVRTVMVNNEPWFIARDVGDVLEIANVRDTVRLFPQNERADVGITDTSSLSGMVQKRKMIIINEPGLYRLIFQSRKQEAERFKTYVFTEVLPQIRKTGNYSAPVAVEDLKKSLMIAQSSLNTYKRLWEESRRTIKRHENRNFLTSDDKREILTLHVKGYPVSAIQQITKKGRTRIKNFLDEFYSMDDSAQDVLFDEWEKADNLGIREESA